MSFKVFHYFIGSCTSEEDDTESELQTSRAPNTSALETLVRTACESLAVSTLLAGDSSSSNLLDASGQQTSKDIPSVHNSSLGMEACSSSGGSNLYTASTSALNQTSSAEDPVFSVLFGNNRDQNSRSTTDERQTCDNTSPSKELQESNLDLTQSSLSDIGDGEVIHVPETFTCLNHIMYMYKYDTCNFYIIIIGLLIDCREFIVFISVCHCIFIIYHILFCL